MKIRLVVVALMAMMVLAVCSCHKKTIIWIKNTSGTKCEIRLDGKSYAVDNNEVIELMYLRGTFMLDDSHGGAYTYTYPSVPAEYIEKNAFNDKVRLLINQRMEIYILNVNGEVTPQPLGFPIRPRPLKTNQACQAWDM